MQISKPKHRLGGQGHGHWGQSLAYMGMSCPMHVCANIKGVAQLVQEL